jgi:hypothetical protein
VSQTKEVTTTEFWLFHDIEEAEVTELRKFIPPELDLESVKGIDKLFTKLNHLLE